MKNIKIRLLLVIFFVVENVSGSSFSMPVVNHISLKELSLWRSKLGSHRFDLLLNKADMRHMRSVDFSSLFKEPELLFDTHIPQWVREKKPLPSIISKDSSFYITNYGNYAFAAVLVGAGMYGGYRFYKNLQAKKKAA